MSKILTVAIPAYNVADYIEETVQSITKSKYIDKIEVLIVNDGSKDDTSKIGKQLEQKYPSVKLVNKKNGGHGSTINKGLEVASGKYFRLLDGDDWYDTEEFDKYMERLCEEDADIVLTDLVERYLQAGLSKPVSYYAALPEYRKFNLDEQLFDSWGPMLPATTIKTKLLRNFGLKIDEHCFYVDQEYNLACYICAKTAVYYPLMIYQYRLEREGQSMQKSSLIRNVYSHEKVCVRLLSEYKKYKDSLSETKQHYLENRVIIPMCHMQYAIATNYCKSRKAFLSFDQKLKHYQRFYHDKGVAGNIINLHRKSGGWTVPFGQTIERVATAKNERFNPRKVLGLVARPATKVEHRYSYVILGLLLALPMIYSWNWWWVAAVVYVYVSLVKVYQLRQKYGCKNRVFLVKLVKLAVKLLIAVAITLAVTKLINH